MPRPSRPRAHSLRRETITRSVLDKEGLPGSVSIVVPGSPQDKARGESTSPWSPTSPPRIMAFSMRRLWTARNIRRLLGAIVAALVVASVLMRRPIGLLPSGEPVCQFVSTWQAYQADLEHLCALHNLQCNLTTPLTQRAHHTYSPTGHLVLSNDTSAPHPIPQLIALGEKRWEELLSRQSRTLGEAVREYQARYGRRPPRGFDKWWAFAVKHSLVLPDEYDQIDKDLAPFWAFPKEELQRRLTLVENMPEVFVVVVDKHKVRIRIKDQGGFAWDGTRPRAKQTAAWVVVSSPADKQAPRVYC